MSEQFAALKHKFNTADFSQYLLTWGELLSGLQIYYLSNTNADGADGQCEKLGWKRMKEYDPHQKLWKYLDNLAKGWSFASWRWSGLQIYYLSNTNADGADGQCEKLGWKRMKEYDPHQKLWKYLDNLAKGNASQDDLSLLEDDLVEEDYYPSLPFAVVFSCFKVSLICHC